MPEQNIQKMQRDAEQRIREMQRRADKAVLGGDMPPVPNFVKTGQNSRQPQSKPMPPKNDEVQNTKPQKSVNPSGNRGLNFLKLLNFKGLKFDKDVSLIVVLILLLSSDETDEMLIFALIYIML
jgi:hypothetical protein